MNLRINKMLEPEKKKKKKKDRGRIKTTDWSSEFTRNLFY